MKTLTTVEAADRLGITARRVRALIQSQQLPAEKKGRDYLIDEKDLRLVKNRKPGRPRSIGKLGQPKNKRKVKASITERQN